MGDSKHRLQLLARDTGGRRSRSKLSRRLAGAAHGDAHARVFDRHLLHAGLLDDADDLADALGAARLVAPCLVVVPAAATADRVEQRLGILSEEREQAELLVARRQPVRHLPGSGDVDGRLLGRLATDELHRALDGRVDRGRGRPEVAGDERLQLVDDRLVALGGEDVHERLRAENLPDRGGERRRPDLRSDAGQLVEHLVDPVSGRIRLEMDVERRHEPGRQAMLRGQGGHTRRRGRHRLVADELVDEVGGFPDAVRVDARVETEARQRRRRRLGRNPVERERERVDGARDEIGARAGGLQRRGERNASGALAVEADRKARHLAHLADEVRGPLWAQRSRRIVDEHTGGAELRHAASPARR